MLEKKHRKAWLKPLAAINREAINNSNDFDNHFERGLLAWQFFDTSTFLLKACQAALPDVLAAVGVEELCFYSSTKRIADLVAAPALRWVAGVQYPGADDKALAAFAKSPYCHHFTKLNLEEVKVTDAGLKSFAKSTDMNRLRAITISTDRVLTYTKPKFTAAGVLALLHSKRVPKLSHLKLARRPRRTLVWRTSSPTQFSQSSRNSRSRCR